MILNKFNLELLVAKRYATRKVSRFTEEQIRESVYGIVSFVNYLNTMTFDERRLGTVNGFPIEHILIPEWIEDFISPACVRLFSEDRLGRDLRAIPKGVADLNSNPKLDNMADGSILISNNYEDLEKFTMVISSAGKEEPKLKKLSSVENFQQVVELSHKLSFSIDGCMHATDKFLPPVEVTDDVRKLVSDYWLNTLVDEEFKFGMVDFHF